MSVMKRKFGRLHVHDPRDNDYPIRRGVVRRKDELTYRYWNACGWWGDQGTTPQCVGYGWAHWLEDGPVTHRGQVPLVSPQKIYHLAKTLDEYPGERYQGTSVRGGAKAMRQLGWVSEFRWAMCEQDIVHSLLYEGPLVVGTLWTEDMSEPDVRGVVTSSGRVTGGHCYVLDGINTVTSYVRIKNSWGRSWGRNGFCYLPLKELCELLFEKDGEACQAVEVRDVRRQG